jgi:hypothetical protein
MNKTLLLCVAFASTSLVAQQPAATMKATLESVDKIWDRGKHNGFSDIIRFQNLWYCCLREGDANIGGGKIRVLASYDTKTWSPVAMIEEADVDLREPRFCPTKEERLFMVAGGSVYKGAEFKGRRPRVVTSTDGKHWSPPEKALAEGDWLWRAIMSPTEKRYFAVAYNQYPNTGGPKLEPEWSAKLYNSVDAKAWSLTAQFDVKGAPNECTVRILKDGTMMALLKRDNPAVGKKGMIGSAAAPYHEWTWKELPGPVVGPNFVELPDGRLIAGSAGFGSTPGAHMVLFEMTREGLKSILELPSGGDCSYPGMLFHEGVLYVSYHSSHEGKTSVYLARVKVE